MTDGTPKIDGQDELARLTAAARDALTDSMVERLAMTGANTLEVVDRLNDEDTKDAVLYMVDRLTELHRVGALETLFDAVALLHAARQAMTDSMMERLFGYVEHMISSLGSEEFAALSEDARAALYEAVEETATAPARGGMMATLSMLSKPETQRSLNFLVAFGERLRQRMGDGNAG